MLSLQLFNAKDKAFIFAAENISIISSKNWYNVLT